MNLHRFQGVTCTAVATDGNMCRAPANVIDGSRHDKETDGFAVFRCVFSCESHWWLDFGHGVYELLVRVEGGDLYLGSSKTLGLNRSTVLGETVDDRMVIRTSDGTIAEVEKVWATKVIRRSGKILGLSSLHYIDETGHVDVDMPVALEYEARRNDAEHLTVYDGESAPCTAVLRNGVLCRIPSDAASVIRLDVEASGFVEFSCVFACSRHWQEHVAGADDSGPGNL